MEHGQQARGSRVLYPEYLHLGDGGVPLLVEVLDELAGQFDGVFAAGEDQGVETGVGRDVQLAGQSPGRSGLGFAGAILPGAQPGTLGEDGGQCLASGAGVGVEQGHHCEVGRLGRTRLIEHFHDLAQGLEVLRRGGDEQAVAVAGVGRDLNGALEVEGHRAARVAADVEFADLLLEFTRLGSGLAGSTRAQKILERRGHGGRGALLEREDSDFGFGIFAGSVEGLDHFLHLGDERFTSHHQQSLGPAVW